MPCPLLLAGIALFSRLFSRTTELVSDPLLSVLQATWEPAKQISNDLLRDYAEQQQREAAAGAAVSTPPGSPTSSKRKAESSPVVSPEKLQL